MLEVKNTCPYAEETESRNPVDQNWIKCKLTDQGCVCSYILSSKSKYFMNGTYQVCPGYLLISKNKYQLILVSINRTLSQKRSCLNNRR